MKVTHPNAQHDIDKYTDKYFIRSEEILHKYGINPTVRYQVFVRADIAKLKGIEEATNFILNATTNTKVESLQDGESALNGEPLMKIEGPVQELIKLETIYLSIISGALTGDVDMSEVETNAKAIVNAAKGKPVMYFGARHFDRSLDKPICKICKNAGFVGCSTDNGAREWGDFSKGMGTIPHSMILALSAYLQENTFTPLDYATSLAGVLFDNTIDKKVPRIVLVDTFNREIDDSLFAAFQIKTLNNVRIDTCGENYSQGAIKTGMALSNKYTDCKGVSIKAVWALRRALDNSEFKHVGIVVSSGFNAEKTTAFVEADKLYQKLYNNQLFTSIGTGSIAKATYTTSDIVAYYNKKSRKWIPMSKVGRSEKPSERLKTK